MVMLPVYGKGIMPVMDLICSNHKLQIEYICRCNMLLCISCLEDKDHEFSNNNHIDHIFDIKTFATNFYKDKDNNQINNQINNNQKIHLKDSIDFDFFENDYNRKRKRENSLDNNNNNDTINIDEDDDNILNSIISNNNDIFIKSKIDSIWSTIKLSSFSYQSLKTKEDQITTHFKQLHDFLLNEEKDLKKPIINDLETLNQKINNLLEELDYLLNIININNTLINQTPKEKKDNNKNQDNNKSIDNNQNNNEEEIIKSIINSKTIYEFININKLNHQSNVNFHTCLNSDIVVLDSIYNYNKQFPTTTIPFGNEHRVDIINQQQFESLKQTIKRSCKLTVYNTQNKDQIYKSLVLDHINSLGLGYKSGIFTKDYIFKFLLEIFGEHADVWFKKIDIKQDVPKVSDDNFNKNLILEKTNHILNIINEYKRDEKEIIQQKYYKENNNIFNNKYNSINNNNRNNNYNNNVNNRNNNSNNNRNNNINNNINNINHNINNNNNQVKEYSTIIIKTCISCINPGKGAWACLLFEGENTKQMKEENATAISNGEQSTTNNRMELMAVIKGITFYDNRSGDKQFIVYTDSKYVQQGITTWIQSWTRNNWKTSSNKPVKNDDLWKELYEINLKNNITFKWIQGKSDRLIRLCNQTLSKL